jgi:lipopolysaccharide/colanic/teichoic acid biosynthesis glycosyltransferase
MDTLSTRTVTELAARRETIVAAAARKARPSLAELAAKVREQAGRRLDAGQPTVAAEGNRSLAYRVLKRAFDFSGALALLLLFAPIMLGTLIVLTITTKGRPIFVQERIGYRGRKFPMFKFRTMRLDADNLQAAVKNEKDGPIFNNRRDPRITKIGRVLRSTSIDEMPQLFNILLGHMALVGPRPPVEKEVRQYEPWQHGRLAVMPGLTCLWQVSGRSEIGFVDWVRMDLWYVKNQNFWTDLHLLIKTPMSVISGKGAY